MESTKGEAIYFGDIKKTRRTLQFWASKRESEYSLKVLIKLQR